VDDRGEQMKLMRWSGRGGDIEQITGRTINDLQTVSSAAPFIMSLRLITRCVLAVRLSVRPSVRLSSVLTYQEVGKGKRQKVQIWYTYFGHILYPTYFTVMCNLRAAVSACVRALLSGSHCT